MLLLVKKKFIVLTTEPNMFNFVIGVVFGIVVATIGVQGVAGIADSGVSKIQNVAREAAR